MNIGRNDPCPCGSGKKFKNCCINTFDAIPFSSTSEPRKTQWFYEDVSKMNDEAIIGMLSEMGIRFEKDAFLQDIEKHYSAESIAEKWVSSLGGRAEGLADNLPSVAARVLWERVAPEHKASMEQIYGSWILKGYELAEQDKSVEACELFLKAWNAIKYRIRSEDRSTSRLDQCYEGTFFASNFLQDLEEELHNAGIKNPAFFEKRIAFCREFCEFFPDEDTLTFHNMRRAIADSYASLRQYDRAKEELDLLIVDFPENPWSYIQYGDIYQFEPAVKDRAKALEFYNQALRFAVESYDIAAIEERIHDDP